MHTKTKLNEFWLQTKQDPTQLGMSNVKYIITWNIMLCCKPHKGLLFQTHVIYTLPWTYTGMHPAMVWYNISLHYRQEQQYNLVICIHGRSYSNGKCNIHNIFYTHSRHACHHRECKIHLIVKILKTPCFGFLHKINFIATPVSDST